MPAKLPVGQERTEHPVTLTHAERQAIKKTVADHPTITTYGGLLQAFLGGETIAFHEVDPDGSKDLANLKFYLDAKSSELFHEAMERTGMNAPSWIRYAFFGTTFVRKNAAKNPKAKQLKVTFTVTPEELRLLLHGKNIDGSTESLHQWAKSKVIEFTAQDAQNFYAQQLADSTDISK